MSKFHVNDNGESGKCSAGEGGRGCPFGGESDHHDSKEAAEKAYETSMQDKLVPKVSKREEEVPFNAPEGELNRLNYKRTEFGGFEYDEVIFDEQAAEEKVRMRVESLYSNSDESERERMITSNLENSRKRWENDSRTEKAKSGEKDVPIRLITVGSEVAVRASNGRMKFNKVGKPVDNGDGHIVGKYRDVANKWDYVESDTTFETGYVNSENPTDTRWNTHNDKAVKLADSRDRAKNILRDQSKFRRKSEVDARLLKEK